MTSNYRKFLERVQNFESVDDLPEDGVLQVQGRLGRVSEEELKVEEDIFLILELINSSRLKLDDAKLNDVKSRLDTLTVL